MVIELVAGRVISRHLGSSLYTWTSVIGVVLAGIAAGNYAGGRIADRRRAAPTLAILFLAAAASCVAVTVLNHVIGQWVFLWSLPWSVRVGTHVAIVFLVPSVILGMISPVAAKMALDQGRETGRTIGGVYAWGVAGSLVGTFLTGFWLIAAFGTAVVIWSVGAVLVVMGILFAGAGRIAAIAVPLFVVVGLLGTGPWSWARDLGARIALREVRDESVLYQDESQYSHIRVYRVSESPDQRNLHLDKLLHSSIVMERPSDLQYGYERIYAGVTRRLAGGRDSLNTLTIGGGGYVFPRFLQSEWPRGRTEVVEIDPAVTRAAIAAFGLPADHGLLIRHADGRAFVERLGEAQRRGEGLTPYDFIYLDVFDDYSVPYQLTTLEFLRRIEALLAEDGAYMMNLIDVFREGRLLGAMIATLKTVFPHVVVFNEGVPAPRQPDVRNTFILVATKRPAELDGLIAGYDRRYGLSRLRSEDLADLERSRGGRSLTDDWAPVENLLAPVVKGASREIAANVLAGRAATAQRAGRSARALRNAERALTFVPDHPRAHRVLGTLRLSSGDFGRAVSHLEIVVRAQPQDAGTRNSLGVALLRNGRVDEALEQFTEAVRLDPDHEMARENLRKLSEATRSRSGRDGSR
jgi:spermidine synthase